MKARFLYIVLLVSLAFTSCDNMHPEVDIKLRTDNSKILQAISDADKSLSEKLALIEVAAGTDFALNQSVLELIHTALSSLEGTLDEKIAAIRTAMSDQATSLETKLALAEAAVSSGFADAATQRALLQDAVGSMGGTMEQKLAAIAAAVRSQTSSLETKLGLIEAAVSAGFADTSKAQELLSAAIGAAGKTLEEKLAAIEGAVSGQTASLEAKLALIDKAIEDGFADSATLLELLQKAVESLGGTMEERLAALETAVKSPYSRMETKIDLIAAALEAGFGDWSTAIDNLNAALTSGKGALDPQISGFKNQVMAQLEAIASQLSTDELAKVFKSISDAVDSQTQSEGEVLSAILTALQGLEAYLKEGPFVLLATLSSEVSAVKDAWADGDVIFVFFDNVAAPKHLKMSYDGSSWTYREMDGDKESEGCLELRTGCKGKMTAVYLPSGSGATVSTTGTDFVFSDTSSGWYLSGTMEYTVIADRLPGKLEMGLPEGHVLFSMPDDSASAGTKAELREQNLTPICLEAIEADLTARHTSLAYGSPLKGYVLGSSGNGWAFGGILYDDVRNVQNDYFFTLVKGGWKGSYYSRTLTATLCPESAGSSSVALPSPAEWTPITDYKPIDMGTDIWSAKGKSRIYWSSRNLGATSDDLADGEAAFGKYYAWGETSPKEEFYWKNYKWSNADSTAVTKYIGTADTLVPGIHILLPEDDAAHAALGGLWITPRASYWEYFTVGVGYTCTKNGSGHVITCTKAGYDGPDGPSLSFPAQGYNSIYGLVGMGDASYYWSSQRFSGISADSDKHAYIAVFQDDQGHAYSHFNRYCGLPIRPITF